MLGAPQACSASSDFAATAQTDASVTLAAVIEPRTAYPWRVRVETTYALDETGLTQTVHAVNESEDAAPFGTGPHPYLVAGAAPLDDWTFELPASEVLEVTADRLAPTELVQVDGSSRFDWRTPRALGGVEIDHAFTGLARTGGVAAARVTDPSVDLSAAIAIASAALDRHYPRRLLALGEVGLAGDLRRVPGVERRLAEAGRLGFELAVVPRGSRDVTVKVPRLGGLRVVEVDSLADALGVLDLRRATKEKE